MKFLVTINILLGLKTTSLFSTMESKRFIQSFILFGSTIICLYQFSTAILKIQSKQTIDSSEILDLNDPRIKLPVITACKRDQFPRSQRIGAVELREWLSYMVLWEPSFSSAEKFSFGKHLNMTYKDLLVKFTLPSQNFQRFRLTLPNGTISEVEHTTVFYQHVGRCFELDSYPLVEEIILEFKNESEEQYDVFVTDSMRKVSFGIEYSSQLVDRILIQKSHCLLN